MTRSTIALALAFSTTIATQAQITQLPGYWDNAFGPAGIGGQGLRSQAMTVARNPINGDVYVGGEFNMGDGKNEIVRWDGSQWTAVGMGTNSTVYALAFAPDGTLYVGGGFTTVRQADGTVVEALRVAAWDGTSWSALGRGASVGRVSHIEYDEASGRVFIGGDFPNVINEDGSTVLSSAIAYWDGSTWNAVGQGANDVRTIAIDPNSGDLLVGGRFLTTGYNADGTSVDLAGLGRWNGAQWQAFGNPGSWTNTLKFDAAGQLYAAGRFSEIGGVPVSNVARYNGTTWEAPGGPPNGPSGQEITELFVEPAGLFAVGRFTEVLQADGTVDSIQRITYLDFATGTWLPLGPTRHPDSFINEIYGTSEEVWVVGAFRDIGGRPADRVSRWFRSNRPFNTTVSTFSIDVRSARRHGLFNLSANIMMEVAGGDTEGYHILEDADGDTVYTVVTEQPSGRTIDHSFLIDRNGNAEGEGSDWIHELDYPEVLRAVSIPATGPFSIPVSLFDDRDPAVPLPGETADAVEILLPRRLGRTLAFFGDVADRIYYDADFIDRVTASMSTRRIPVATFLRAFRKSRIMPSGGWRPGLPPPSIR